MKNLVMTAVVVFSSTANANFNQLTCTKELSGDRGSQIVTVENFQGSALVTEAREVEGQTLVFHQYEATIKFDRADAFLVAQKDFSVISRQRRLRVELTQNGLVGTLRIGNQIVRDEMNCSLN